MKTLLLVFKGTFILFSIMAASIYISTSVFFIPDIVIFVGKSLFEFLKVLMSLHNILNI